MYYLRIENGIFGFVVKKVHDIKPTDIPIETSDYISFLDQQAQGKEFSLKPTPTGNTLFDYVEAKEQV